MRQVREYGKLSRARFTKVELDPQVLVSDHGQLYEAPALYTRSHAQWTDALVACTQWGDFEWTPSARQLHCPDRNRQRGTSAHLS